MDTSLLEQFDREGYVHLRGLVGPAAVAALRTAVESAPERDDADNPLSLDSMRFASNLFYGSAEIRRFLGSEPVVSVVTSLCGPDVWVRWDQAVWKGADAPVFPWHQDNGYTELGEMHLQVWVALTAMDRRNGGLLVAPGGHRDRPDHRWVGHHLVIDEPDRVVAIDAAAGDVVVFSSFLPHATTPNSTTADRLAYVAEFLPLDVPDRSVRPAHLVVARGGRPALGFEDLSARWGPPGP